MKKITLDPFTASFYSMYAEQRKGGDSPKKSQEFGFINYLKRNFGIEFFSNKYSQQ